MRYASPYHIKVDLLDALQQTFPDLHGYDLVCNSMKSEAVVATCQVNRIHRQISLEVCLADFQRMSRREQTGCLVHELCHARRDVLHGSLWESLRYAFWPPYCSRLERSIDHEVIDRGYGYELLAFQRYHDRHYEAYREQDGLTTAEIDRILKSRRGNPEVSSECAE